MNLQLEKEAIIERLQTVDDESLIKALKNLLDYAIGKEEENQLLEDSIKEGLEQSARGEGRSHSIVMEEMKAKYKK